MVLASQPVLLRQDTGGVFPGYSWHSKRNGLKNIDRPTKWPTMLVYNEAQIDYSNNQMIVPERVNRGEEFMKERSKTFYRIEGHDIIN